MTNTIAIIPARSGSKSVEHKNVSLLSGFPLIAYSIAAASLSETNMRVIVSTNSEEYAEIARAYGAEVPFIRPEAISTDASTDRDFMLHAMQWFQDNEATIPEYWVHLRPTTPLREVSVVDRAIRHIHESPDATSLRSGFRSPESPLKWFRRNENQYFKGLLERDDQDEYYNLPKEAFPDVYVPDGYVDVIKTSHTLNHPTLHGDRMLGFESPVCSEVDSEEELDYIQYQIDKKGSSLLDYLNKEFKGNRR